MVMNIYKQVLRENLPFQLDLELHKLTRRSDDLAYRVELAECDGKAYVASRNRRSFENTEEAIKQLSEEYAIAAGRIWKARLDYWNIGEHNIEAHLVRVYMEEIEREAYAEAEPTLHYDGNDIIETLVAPVRIPKVFREMAQRLEQAELV